MFYGDGLLCPPDGYGEPIVELLVMRRPDAVFKSYFPGEEALGTRAALQGAPAIIGKAPDFAFLGLGSSDILQGIAPASALENLHGLIQLLLLKTQARVTVANVCGAFLPAEARAVAEEYNTGLFSLAEERVRVVDLDGPVNGFLEVHRRGGGEKRSLHVHPMRLTPMGRVFLSHTAHGLLALEDFFPV